MLKRLYSFFTGGGDTTAEDATSRAQQSSSKRFKKVTFADQKRLQGPVSSAQFNPEFLCGLSDSNREDNGDEVSQQSDIYDSDIDLPRVNRVPMPKPKQHQPCLHIEDVNEMDVDDEDDEDNAEEQQEDEASHEGGSSQEGQDEELANGEDGDEQSSQRAADSDNSDESPIGQIKQKRALKSASKADHRQKKIAHQSSQATSNETGSKTQVKKAQKLLKDASVQMRTLKKTLDQSFKGVEELNCPICMDYIVSCRTAICGHSFCEMCISESLIHRKECPNCRKDIRKWVLAKSEIIDSAVKLMVTSKNDVEDNSELKRYHERVKAHQEWLKKQTLVLVKPGEKVDALDTEYIWCKAVVELKIQARGRKPLLYLHYEGWSRKYDEYIYVDSRRIAPLGLFTNRTDIPRYQNNSANRMPMNYAQVIDSARNMQLNQDQIENAEVNHNEQIDINDPNQIEEEPNNEGDEASYESLLREEPDPENQENGRGAGSDAAGAQSNQQGANLNRDSNLGRRGEPGSSIPQRSRPVTRNNRSPFSFSLDTANRHVPVFSQSNGPFFNATRSSTSIRNPFRQSSQVFTSAAGENRERSSRRPPQPPISLSTSLNRSVSQSQSNLVGLPHSFSRQNNREDTSRANGNIFCDHPQNIRSSLFGGNATASRLSNSREDRVSSPRPFGNRESRRLSVPSNTGNIMRGANQSNIFGTISNLDRCCPYARGSVSLSQRLAQRGVNVRSQRRGGEPETQVTRANVSDQEAGAADTRPAAADDRATNSARTAAFLEPFIPVVQSEPSGPPNEPQQDQPEQAPQGSEQLTHEAVVPPSITEVESAPVMLENHEIISPVGSRGGAAAPQNDANAGGPDENSMQQPQQSSSPTNNANNNTNTANRLQGSASHAESKTMDKQ